MIVPRARRSRRGSHPFASFLCLLLLALGCQGLVGCGSRRPVANRRQPPPAQPSPVPAESAEKAKNDTGVGPSSPPLKTPRTRPASPAVVGHVEEGNASWYGVPFHGRRSSNGEVYDMNRLTAAHRTLPFDTQVRVTNLDNGKSTAVRITDRGPFVENRVIDLSRAAAREIEMIGPGVVPVRLEIVSGPEPVPGFFGVQVGAFRDRANAGRLRERLSASYSPVLIQTFDAPDGAFYRVRVGRLATEDDARRLGEALRAREGFTPFVVRLDEIADKGGNP